MSQATRPKEKGAAPVVYVHAEGRGVASAEDFAALAEAGCTVCSRLGSGNVVQTKHGPDEPGALLKELAERFPGRPVAFVRAGLRPTKAHFAELDRLLHSGDETLALTLLSNAWPELNPFAALTPFPDNVSPEELIELLAPGYLHEIRHWPGHFVLLPAEIVKRMAGCDSGTAMQRLQASGGRIAATDALFLHDSASRLDRSPRLNPWESHYPPPFGELSARLQRWMEAGIESLPFSSLGDGAATLHITHNWGGGIAHWIQSFIDNDPGRRHFQLRAEGPRSEMGSGQRLSLYAGNETRCPVASWWLQPPIQSVEDRLPAYRELMAQLCRRYRIGRVVVSSLIGHSLDALRTGMPTLQVMHDHFPLWPLLSRHPGPWLRDGGGLDIESALESRGKQEFTDKNAAAWSSIQSAYLEAVKAENVVLAAPGQSVLDLQQALAPGFPANRVHIIPHGSAADATDLVAPRPRDDGRLRLVVLGRMQEGKGQKLLRDAIGELTKHVQVYLVGSGMSGEAFFGISGVDVIPQYDAADLPGILGRIGPHFAALLSIVPETYSYTLSELRLLGIPVIATRVGSFPARIDHGRTGWLIEPEPEALLQQVEELCSAPEKIEGVRAGLDDLSVPGPADMVAAYNRVFQDDAEPAVFCPVEPGNDAVQAAAADHQLEHVRAELKDSASDLAEIRAELESRTERMAHELKTRTERLTREIEIRTEWALDTQKQLQREQRLRLDVEASLADTKSALAQLRQQHQRLRSAHERVLSSSSWKLTRPLRASRRTFEGVLREGAWDPRLWPALARGESLESESAISSEPAVAERYGPPDSLPEVTQPDVSIVIPVHNNWMLTAACLQSLADESGGRYSFEVIVIDDASGDDTAEQLAGIENLAVLRNDENLGFVGSCNRAAAKAQGDYLVFLNNDTRVTEGWLDALIDTLIDEPRAGLVGARLVYPGGRLQESGGIIFSDGSGWNYGRDDPADDPAYGFLREADYCSGACIALRRNLFEQLGGFDDRYAPAYYEDTDLAFRVREAGLKVLVQPGATVIHHEGATSGMDTSSGMKRYQLINQDTFVERWSAELQQQPAPVHDRRDRRALRKAAAHRLKGSVLVLAPDDPEELGRLGSLLACWKILGFGVTLADPEGILPRETLRGFNFKGSETLQSPKPASLNEWLAERGANFDFVLLTGPKSGARHFKGIRQHCTQAKLVLDAGFAEPGIAPAKEWRTLAMLVDATLVRDPAQRETLSAVAQKKPVLLYGPENEEEGDCSAIAALAEPFFSA